ncbi:MAG: hypothetical protein ABSE82_06915 [Nitrososphaerales archaeon]
MLSQEQSAHDLSSSEAETQVIRKVRVSARKAATVEQQRCDFCGRAFSVDQSTLGGSERRKYCSKSCQSRASQGRIKARLAAPPSKRYAARLKFSSPLYFN